MLIECDPSIKSIIVNIDSKNHDFIIEDLDEERVVVKENMVGELKRRLEDVSRHPTPSTLSLALHDDSRYSFHCNTNNLPPSASRKTFLP